MVRGLREETKSDIKCRFRVAENGWWYHPEEGDPIYLTCRDLNLLHDFVVFQYTKEYLDWFKGHVK